MRQVLSNHPLATALISIGGVLVAAFLAFGYFGIQAAFTTTAVNEAGPAFTPAAVTGSATSDGPAEVSTVAQGTFAGADSAHSVTGSAVVLTDGEQRVLRLADFASTNGPDLKVYLRAANGDVVSLGDLKGNVGDQNYDIPAGVDLDTYSTVQIWCERFSVLFGSAELADH